ncbi:P-loop containing nucleoside triphosphate hydrolase protein [Leucosporidium creatinivorum]|uniref:Kinesin-like protein n=1 Tax=Leucosporidium creatinivorum TaxID=106004 RepID=A0A1Y2EYU4_9BASI|nr:P-loop containing nucleoside triphosphate hydrolase protein [Leucosporidium creatinivorum]
MAPTPSRLSSTASVASTSSPLLPTTAHNVPSVAYQTTSPPPEFRTPAVPRKVLSSQPQQQQQPQQAPSSPLTSAPRLRAKLTPAATPRRKNFLPGTEFADVPTRRTDGGGHSPVKRAPPPPLAVTPSTPMARPMAPPASYGSFPSYTEDAFDMSAMSAGLAGLGVGSRIARSTKGKDNVLVCVRIRPPAAKLAAATTLVEERAWNVDEQSGRLTLKTGHPEFTFDSVVTGSDNEAVYEEAGKDLVLAAMEGFDACIFAYGQTASGKTFTLTGNPANPGIIPQAVTEIFTYIREHPEQEFLLRASYLEIYNETLKDLLAPETGPLRVRQDEKKRFFVHPLREEVVTGEAQVAALLRRGEANRSVGQTDFNETSSRSHSLFQMTIESRDDAPGSPPPSATPLRPKTPNGPRLSPGANGAVRMSRLTLIDLAGSEQATSQSERRSEGAFINKSLLTLEKVIASLTEDSKRKPHVPYRDSKLTQILQPSLAGDARVAVIATMNPSPAAVEETKSTLKFATRIKKVVLKAVVNEVVDDKTLIFKYRHEIARLQAQLEAQASVPSTPSMSEHSEEKKNSKSSARIEGIESQISELRSLFITSNNVEDRRQSMLPPRPVSPTKMLGDSDSDEPTLAEKYLESQDEVAYLTSENQDLKRRIEELEGNHLQQTQDRATESDKDAEIARLMQANQEMLVVIKNADSESEMKRQEMRFRREVEKRLEIERRLREEVEFERGRITKMERFIFTSLQNSVDILAGRRSSIGVARPSLGGGLLPIMGESSPDLDHGEFGDLEFFSEEAREKIKKSGSMLFA